MIKPTRIVVLLCCLGVVAGCASRPCVHSRNLEKGVVQTFSMRLQGHKRTYQVYVPSGIHAYTNVPLVVALHGAFSSACELQQWSGLNRLAERDNVVVAYPNGYGLFGYLQHWNAGHCCGRAVNIGLDDELFIRSMVGEIRRHLSVGKKQFYLLGYSNGGMLANTYAANHPEDVAALAVVAGAVGSSVNTESLQNRLPYTSSKHPVLIIHGQQDEIVPYQGGKTESTKDRLYLPAREQAVFWAKNNDLDVSDAVCVEDSSIVKKERWGGAGGNDEVTFITLKNWGHLWPGGPFVEKLPAGHPVKQFKAAETIWGFFGFPQTIGPQGM